MENGGKRITKIKLYKCGYCKNNLRHMFQRHKKEIRDFPALAVLIQHKELGNILYDTGYSELIYKNHFVSFLYNTVNRAYVKESDTIVSQLMSDGIEPDSIGKIILSHAHPDHIGGLKLFEGYELLSTKKVIDTLKNGNVFQLVFRNMVPDKEIVCKAVKPMKESNILEQYFDKTYDVLGDGSIIGVELNGHAEEQLGIYLPEYQLLFVADACWGEDLLCKVKDMSFIAKKIQNNYKDYAQTAAKLEQLSMEHPEIKMIYSHDETEEEHYE